MSATCPSCHQSIPPSHGITIDGRAVIFNNTTYVLTASEIATFQLLLTNIGRTVRRQALYDNLYGLWLDEPPNPQIICVLVSKIRKRLVKAGLTILPEYGIGYRLERPGQKPRISNADNVQAAE